MDLALAARHLTVIAALATLAAGCGGGATSATFPPSPAATAAVPAASPSSSASAGARCPTAYTGERVDLSGKVTGTVLPLGGNYFLTVTDSAGRQCELIMHTDPGPTGSTVSVHDYVAYVASGSPPISRIAPPDYPDIPH